MTDNAIINLARRIAKIEKDLRTQGRASQAAFRGVQLGDQPLSFYDEEGNVRLQIGAKTADGAYTVVEMNSSAPPTPTPPIVTPAPGGLVIAYNGTFAGANAPVDLAYVEVHALTDPDQVPDDSNQITTFTSTNGGSFYYATDSADVIYIGLQAVNKSGVESALSALASATPGASTGVDESGNLVVNGYVNQKKVPYLSASAGSQTVATGTDATVTGWALRGTATEISVAAGVFTVTEAGHYQINCVVAFNAAAGARTATLLIGGAVQKKVSGVGTIDGVVSLALDDLVVLNAGGAFSVEVNQSSGADLDLSSDGNYITVIRVA